MYCSFVEVYTYLVARSKVRGRMIVNKTRFVQPKYISKRGHRINNGYLFHKKIEPMKILHPFLGLRSYKKDGSYFSKVGWPTKIYLYFLVTCTTIIFIVNSKLRFEMKLSPLRVIASELVMITAIISVSGNWFSNTNSTPVLKQMNNYNFIENLAPKVNSFVHNSNHLNLFLHLSQVLINLTIMVLTFKKNNFATPTDCFYYFWTEYLSISLDISSFQPCIIVNLLSSYVNVINLSLCETFGRPEYHYENRDALMLLVKNKILRYSDTYFHNTRELQCNRLEVDTMMNIFKKLMDNLEMITHKYNIIVSKRSITQYLCKQRSRISALV